MDWGVDATINTTELDLAEKLLRTFHLNTEERAALIDRRLPLSVIVAAARRFLNGDGCLPEGWDPQDEGDGVVIERRGNDFWLHEQNEISAFGHLSPLRSRRAPDLEAAVIYYLQYFGDGKSLDGVPIDFDR